MKPKVDANDLGGGLSPDKPIITHPVLDETQLSARWNLSPKTLQRWRSEGIGPPAWHLNRSVRYLLMEVEAFERKARVTWKSPTGSAGTRRLQQFRLHALRKNNRGIALNRLQRGQQLVLLGLRRAGREFTHRRRLAEFLQEQPPRT